MTQDKAEIDFLHRTIVDLAREIKEGYPLYYSMSPPSFLALKIRGFLVLCQEFGVINMNSLQAMARVAFSPSPDALKARDKEYLVHIVTNVEVPEDARSFSLEKFMASVRRRSDE